MEMKFDEILNATREWFNNIKSNYSSKITIEIVQNNDVMLHVFFETETHISELIVNQPYFAPYRYVSFMVMDIKQKLPEPVFCCYDNDLCTASDIINKLNAGIEATLL